MCLGTAGYLGCPRDRAQERVDVIDEAAPREFSLPRPAVPELVKRPLHLQGEGRISRCGPLREPRPAGFEELQQGRPASEVGGERAHPAEGGAAGEVVAINYATGSQTNTSQFFAINSQLAKDVVDRD